MERIFCSIISLVLETTSPQKQVIHVYLTSAISDADEHLEAVRKSSFHLLRIRKERNGLLRYATWSICLAPSFPHLFILEALLHPQQLLQESQLYVCLIQEVLCFLYWFNFFDLPLNHLQVGNKHTHCALILWTFCLPRVLLVEALDLVLHSFLLLLLAFLLQFDV